MFFFYSNYYPSSKIYAIIGFFFPFRSTAAYFQASMWQSDSCKDSQQWDHGTLFCPTSPFCSLSSAPPYRRTSHSGTDGLCLCKLKRVLCCAAHACVCACWCLCVLLRVDLCMPMSGFCRTAWKSEEKQNWTLSKQPATKLVESISKTW